MAKTASPAETNRQIIERLRRRNQKLEKIYDEYKQVCRNEEERIKELNCLYQVAHCVVVETDLEKALGKIARIMPNGWQFAEKAAVRITVNGRFYNSTRFFKSDCFQSEDIYLDRQIVGIIEVFYQAPIGKTLQNPFLIEEKNLLSGIANIISFYLKKHRDDENRKIIQQQLLHADRLATIGQLAAGVAHELNEPLGNILGLAQLSLKLPDLPVQAEKDLGKISDCVMYSREIIKKLMEFSRQSSMSKELFEINLLIENCISFIDNRCRKENIAIVREFGEPTFIRADSTQMKQVITNLSVNAIHSMKKGGQLVFKTRVHDDRIIISIEDTGQGIPEGNIGKVFMPFFTTKDIGEGTGLGLSVVYGIVQAHQGDIKVSSKTGKGSIFTVSLPTEGS